MKAPAQFPNPRHLRRWKARMALLGVSLNAVAAKADIPICDASRLLRGRLVDEERLGKLRAAIRSFPVPDDMSWINGHRPIVGGLVGAASGPDGKDGHA